MAESCPTIERWKEHLDGGLAPSLQDELTTHLDQCAACQRTLENIAAGGDSLLDVARQVGEGTQASQANAPRSWSPTLQQETQAEAAAASDEDLAFLGTATKPGTLGRLAHYEAREVIGKGGFGIVLKAFDDKLHRMVAIKVLSPALAASGTARSRFIREARASAAVKNEHVVAIYDVQHDAQPPYLVMELIDGMSLQDKLDQQGSLSLKETLRIGSQMAEGLAAAHKQGLVHRDIKPSNILLENGVERVKITDFGLARAVDDASVTQSGVIAGTPMYMSPEQANGESIDHRSDLFSLGTVLYVICTGRPPFRATGTMAVLKRVIEDTPRPVREIAPEVPEWLETVIAKLHAKRPEERFQTAKEVAELLGERLADVQAGRAPGEPSRVSDRVGAPATMSATRPLTRLRSPRRSALKRAALVIVPLLVLAAIVFRFLPRAADVVRDPAQKVGVLSLRLSDMAMQYRIDGHGANQTGVGVVQLPLEPGEHKIWFALGDRQFETLPFTMTAGKAAELSLEVTGEDGLAILDGKALGVTRIGIQSGWVQVFNGKDLTGWHNKPNGKNVWQVIDGVLNGQSKEPVFLWSDREDYGDFHLRVETRVQDSGDGGILFRFAPGKEGYEAEIRPGSEMPTGSLWRYADFAKLAKAAAFLPSDEWFILEVIARGNRLQVLVNGRVTADVTDTASIKGRLAIQSAGTGGSVEYRKIEIKELPPEEPGWVQLFNGKDLTGWRAAIGKKDAWGVKDGAIVGSGESNYLLTEKETYRDFHFRVKVKINAKGDSGILFRGRAFPKDFLQAQILNCPDENGTGSISCDRIKIVSVPSPNIPDDTWFDFEVIAQGDRIETRVNGKVAGQAVDRNMLAGAIGLESGNPETVVHFKNIEIKELPSAVDPFLKAAAAFADKLAKSAKMYGAKSASVGEFVGAPVGFREALERELKARGIVVVPPDGERPREQLRVVGSLDDVRTAGNQTPVRIDYEWKGGAGGGKGSFNVEGARAWTPGLPAKSPPLAVAPIDAPKAKQHQDAWAKHLGVPVEIENSIGMKLRLIPPGEFDMGAGDKDADARPEEKPNHRAVIRHSFYMGATEVTRSQYQAVMKQGGRFDPKPILDHPVVAVSWHDATRFCKQLSELDAEKKAGHVYRLPAEVEWEYACRAGTQTPFYFGDIGKMEEYAWFTDNCGGFTNPVAKLKANPWGLYDMLGNVEEWCADTYQGYAAGKIEHDPAKPLPFGTGNNRVARSGSYLTPAKRVTASARTQINPAFATPSLGLRAVMIIDPRVKKQPSAKTSQLFNIGLAYHNYYDVNRKGPATADDLKPFLADDPKAFDALKKGELVFIYGVRLFDLPAGPSGTVLAYEPHTPTKGGLVLMADGVAKEVSAAEFKALPQAAAKKEGAWTPLIGGKELSHWQNPSPVHWSLKDGILSGWLPAGQKDSVALWIKRKDHGDFHLRLEAKLSAGGASPVYFRALPENPEWKGYAVNMNHDIGGARTGSLWDSHNRLELVTVPKTNVKPVEWFTLDIIAEGPRIISKVNGVTTADKADPKAAGNHPRGQIGLSLQPNTVVHFRTIEIKEFSR